MDARLDFDGSEVLQNVISQNQGGDYQPGQWG